MNVAIDISSIIWNKEYFEQDKTSYCQLADEVLDFIDVFEQVNAKFVMRQELLDEILLSFPFELTSNISHFKEFRTNVYKFLSKISDIVGYENIIISELVSIPNILFPHFSEIATTECKYLIREMHTTANHIAFCTFSSIWTSGNLKTKCSNSEKEYVTIIHPTENIETYINSLKKQFEHNSKHDSCKGVYYDVKGKKINPLSCYDERKKDMKIPQELLDNSKKIGNERYSYDRQNRTFVCFKPHSDRKYHGYDIYDEDITDNALRIVLQKIKEEFLK